MMQDALGAGVAQCLPGVGRGKGFGRTGRGRGRGDVGSAFEYFV